MASSHRIHFFHLVWSTKGRRDLILPKMEERLYAYIGGIVRENGGHLLEIGGISDHLHLLVELSRLDLFIGLIRSAKASSTSWIKQEFPVNREFAWQDGYGSFTVSYSCLDKTCEYIRNQKQHHQNQTFEEEYIKFLTLHRIKFDERYVFD